MCIRKLFILFASMVKIISMEFTWKITLNTFGSMRPMIVIVNFLILNWTPLVHMIGAAQQADDTQWESPKQCWGEGRWGPLPGWGQLTVPFQSRGNPCAERHRGICANTEVHGTVKGCRWRKGVWQILDILARHVLMSPNAILVKRPISSSPFPTPRAFPFVAVHFC